MAEHWLDFGGTGDSLGRIGGHPTDVSAIATSLEHKLKDAFPINEVPLTLFHKWETMKTTLQQAEIEIEEFIILFGECLQTKA